MVSSNSAFRCSYKLRYPAASVIVVPIRDENIVFKIRDMRSHGPNIRSYRCRTCRSLAKAGEDRGHGL